MNKGFISFLTAGGKNGAKDNEDHSGKTAPNIKDNKRKVKKKVTKKRNDLEIAKSEFTDNSLLTISNISILFENEK